MGLWEWKIIPIPMGIPIPTADMADLARHVASGQAS